MTYRLASSGRLLGILSEIALDLFESYKKIDVSYEYVAIFYSRSSSYRFEFIPFYGTNPEGTLFTENRSKRELFKICSNALSLLGLDGFEIVDQNGFIVTDKWEKETL